MEKINDYKLTNIEEALNIVTSTSKYWELPTIICDKENPNKFIEVTSSEKTSERGPYLATKFDVYNEGERQKCKEFSHGEFMRYHTYKGDNTSDAGEAHWKNIMIEMKSKGEFNNDVIIFKDVKDFDKYKENPNVDILKPVKKEKPVVFSIKQNDYETFLQNDKISLGDILEVYSKADVKFQEVAKQGSSIDEVTFASLTQNENKVSSISIDMDNNKLSILDGNYENDKTKNYFLDKSVDILNKVGKEKIKNHL